MADLGSGAIVQQGCEAEAGLDCRAVVGLDHGAMAGLGHEAVTDCETMEVQGRGVVADCGTVEGLGLGAVADRGEVEQEYQVRTGGAGSRSGAGGAEDSHSRTDWNEDPHGGKDDHFSGANGAGNHHGRSGGTGTERIERLTMASTAVTGQAKSYGWPPWQWQDGQRVHGQPPWL